MSRSNPRVLNTLERAGGFASAQEVYQLMQREGQSIGLTTVYRSLQSLVNDKIVDVLRRDDGEAIYRLCGESHLKMWWMLITHQAGICCVGPSKLKMSHAVLRYKGEYVDNWTKKFGPKSAIEKNHTFHIFYGYGWAYQTALKMIISKVVRTLKK